MFLCVNPFSNNLFGNPLERWGKRCFPRPETHAVDEHVGLSRFQWPSWLLEGKKNSHWSHWSWRYLKYGSKCLKMSQDSGSQQFKKWRLKRLKRLNLAIYIGPWSDKGVPLDTIGAFITYKPISTINRAYLTNLSTNLPSRTNWPSSSDRWQWTSTI